MTLMYYRVVPSIRVKVRAITVSNLSVISSKESVKTYKRICERMNEDIVYQDLIAGMKKFIN